MSSYLVTGTAGFIGYHISTSLLAQGHSVVGVDNLNTYYDAQLKHARLNQLRGHANFLFCRMDLSDRGAVERLFCSNAFDYVIHFAAQAGVRYSIVNPHAFVDSNMVAFVNVLEGCRHQPPRRLVFASSSSVYGANAKLPFAIDDPVNCPISLYAVTKRSNELMAYAYNHLYHFSITGLRLFTVYGPWGRPDMAIYKFTRSILAHEPIDVFNHGQMRRDFTFIDDVVTAVMKAAGQAGERHKGFRLYNIGNNQPVELSQLVRELELSLGVKAIIRYRDMQPGDVVETFADIEQSSYDLNFRPCTPLREGVQRFVEWYREYHRMPRTQAIESSGIAPAQPNETLPFEENDNAQLSSVIQKPRAGQVG